MYMTRNKDHSTPSPQQPDRHHTFSSKIPKYLANNKAPGFTLIELMVVVSIIGILAAIGTISYFSFIEKARTISAVNEINSIIKNIRIYQIDNPPPLPLNLVSFDSGYADFRDPWGNVYQYTAPPVRTKSADPTDLINTEFDVYSLGRDGQSALDINAAVSQDDIIVADDGHYIGMASRY